MAEINLINLFTRLGLTEQKAKETLKNEALSQTLKEIVAEVKLTVMLSI